MNTETFGTLIKSLRVSNKLTLREVALKIGIDTSMLGKIEKDNRKASKEIITKLADFFDIKPTSLKIAMKSDIVAYNILEDDEHALEILKVAEQKIKYSKKSKKK